MDVRRLPPDIIRNANTRTCATGSIGCQSDVHGESVGDIDCLVSQRAGFLIYRRLDLQVQTIVTSVQIDMFAKVDVAARFSQPIFLQRFELRGFSAKVVTSCF